MSTAGIQAPEANNFMAVEGDLVALLQEAVKDLSPKVHVLTAAELADVKQSRQLAPALQVVYGGPMRIAEDQGTRLILEHIWHVVVFVSHVGSVRTGEHARAEVGPLVARVMSALAGASIQRAIRPLELSDPPRPWFEAGAQFFPISVRVQTMFHKLPVPK